jgi:hypothetical protein
MESHRTSKYNLHVVANNAKQGEPSKAIRRKSMNQLLMIPIIILFKTLEKNMMSLCPMSITRDRWFLPRAEDDVFQNDWPGDSRNARLSMIHSTSSALDLDKTTRAVVDSLDNAIAEKCSVGNDARIVEHAEVKCMDIATPRVEVTQNADVKPCHSTPLVSNQAKKANGSVYNHDEKESEGENTYLRGKTTSYSSSCALEAAKKTDGTVDREVNARNKKTVVRSDEQVGEHSVKTEDSGMARGRSEVTRQRICTQPN